MEVIPLQVFSGHMKLSVLFFHVFRRIYVEIDHQQNIILNFKIILYTVIAAGGADKYQYLLPLFFVIWNDLPFEAHLAPLKLSFRCHVSMEKLVHALSNEPPMNL